MAWVGVITNWAAAYPTSIYSKMGAAQITDTARQWSDALPGVALEFIPELARRTLQSQLVEFAPGLGEVQKAWTAWDVYAEQEMAQQEAREVLLALPEPEGQRETRASRSSSLQMEIIERRGQAVCCYCLWESEVLVKVGEVFEMRGSGYETGLHSAAMLSPDERNWICATAQCNFRHPVRKSMEAPLFPRPSLANDIVTEVETPQEQVAEPQLRNYLRVLCEMDVPSEGDAVKQRTTFGYWLLARFPVAQWTGALAREQWKVWQQEAREKAQVEVAA